MTTPKWFWIVLAVCLVVLTITVSIRQLSAAEASRYQFVPGHDSTADGLYDAHSRRVCYIDADSRYCEDFGTARVQTQRIHVDSTGSGQAAQAEFHGFDSLAQKR